MPIPAWLSNFIGFGWIRDLFGIRKDLIDTKKSKLEVRKLEDDERARNLITPATFEDVKEYDPKYQAIRQRIEERRFRLFFYYAPHAPLWFLILTVIIEWLALLFSVGYLIYMILKWLW
ncbi:MAG TPA: hypothetical protein VF544_24175 [Pyrinomonadaceae bacterium]|jgi:hypothetical protein